MPPLRQLLESLQIKPLAGDPADIEITAVTDDSRRCGPGTLFVAIEGSQADGHDFLAQAAEAGSPAALVAHDAPSPPDFRLLHVPNTRRALALLVQRLAGNPSDGMLTVGITGTNGKTTTAYLLESIFHSAGLRTGVLGTVNYRWGGHVECEPAPQTTPSPSSLADYFSRMKADGVQAVTMEVSSHALQQHRIDGIHFDAVALTNLTQDHLDYHHSMGAYAAAKERLFTEIIADDPHSIAVLNVDDEYGRQFVRTTRAARVMTYSVGRRNALVCATDVHQTTEGMEIHLRAIGAPLVLYTPMLGTFNVYNCLTATAIALALGIPREAIVAGVAGTRGAPGRFEPVRAGQPFHVLVDYAHTPDSIEKLLVNARSITQGRLIVVFGAGGDRDPTKRRPMGLAAARLADDIIVTNDNPRTEDPERIATMVSEGVHAGLRTGKTMHLELDRRKAIAHTLGMARPGDTVVIAGKGHEDYQILGHEKIHFDDREVARELLQAAGHG